MAGMPGGQGTDPPRGASPGDSASTPDAPGTRVSFPGSVPDAPPSAPTAPTPPRIGNGSANRASPSGTHTPNNPAASGGAAPAPAAHAAATNVPYAAARTRDQRDGGAVGGGAGGAGRM